MEWNGSLPRSEIKLMMLRRGLIETGGPELMASPQTAKSKIPQECLMIVTHIKVGIPENQWDNTVVIGLTRKLLR